MALTLDAVNTAIERIESGSQSFTLEGMTYSKANLSALITLRDRLLAENLRTNGTRPMFRAFSFTTTGY